MLGCRHAFCAVACAALLVTAPTSDVPLHPSHSALAAGTAVDTEGSPLEQMLVREGRFIGKWQSKKLGIAIHVPGGWSKRVHGSSEYSINGGAVAKASCRAWSRYRKLQTVQI